MKLPDDIIGIAYDCGYEWSDDPDRQMAVLVGIVRSARQWRHECSRAVQEVRRERMYDHLVRRNHALAKRLRNLRRASREYRSRLNLVEFVKRMCE